MRAATGFHHHQAHRSVGEETLELSARQALLFDHAPRSIGDGDLKHGLRKIDSNNRQRHGSIHLGIILVTLTPHTQHEANWHDDAERSGGVHPITQADRSPAALTRRPLAAA